MHEITVDARRLATLDRERLTRVVAIVAALGRMAGGTLYRRGHGGGAMFPIPAGAMCEEGFGNQLLQI